MHRLSQRIRHRRGQAFIEFTLIVPVLVLLLVMAIDVGRVFFGWIAINNAARIAADFAAERPEAWPADNPLDAQAQAQYRVVVAGDLTSINCDPPDGGQTPWLVSDIPDPAFPNGKAEGDPSIVALTCDFSLLTPLADGLFGGGITLAAEATFPIQQVLTLALPPPRATPTPTPSPTPVPTPTPSGTPDPCATPVAEFSAEPTSGQAPLEVAFIDESTDGEDCPITAWLWDFGDDTTSTSQNPTHRFNAGGPVTTTFEVTLTVTSDAGTDDETKSDYIEVSP